MKIKNTLESLSILTDDDKIYTDLRVMIEKNFSKTLKSKGKTISFYDENEMPQRKYFLKFIKRLYERENNETIDIKFAEYKTIKLNYIQQNTISKVICVGVDFAKDNAIFSIDKKDKLFFTYIIKSFEKCNYILNEKTSTLTLKMRTDDDIEALCEFISSTKHLRFIASFTYDAQKLNLFKTNYKNGVSQKIKSRFNSVASLFSEQFEALGCAVGSSFEAVRESYLCLVKIYHPDRHSNKSDIVKNAYRKQFEKIQLAYEALKPLFKEQERVLSA
ncbi:adenylosuccinate lyase [Campylobacter sp. 9BO]|uniref:adenylosuccinate lyase n=1 Tax=Campylobacter sp. 9BO TaxID=3424759 RepID=UPI003D32AECC